MPGLTFSSKLDWGSYTICIAKTASKEIGALIRSMKFLSPQVVLQLYKSTIRPCMEYCCYVRAGASKCYWELLDKLHKRICRLLVLHLLLFLNQGTIGTSSRCGQLKSFLQVSLWQMFSRTGSTFFLWEVYSLF